MDMPRIYTSIDQLVGGTPLLRFGKLEQKLELKAELLGKLEYFNPTGSIKDRIAWNMIRKAGQEGRIRPGDTLLDFTSGNTGIASAAFANAGGYHYAVVLQPGVSEERKQILRAYGAELIPHTDVPGFDEMLCTTGLVHRTLQAMMRDYAAKRGWFYLDQGCNPDNPDAHYLTTAAEIDRDTDGRVDYIILMVGTGGTMAGISRYFREKHPDTRIIGVQPDARSRKRPDHPEINTIDGVIAFHNTGNLPFFWDEGEEPYDEVIDVVAEDAYRVGRLLVRSDGVFLGQSAAASVSAAVTVAARPEAKGKRIVTVLADNAFKYLSTNMYKD